MNLAPKTSVTPKRRSKKSTGIAGNMKLGSLDNIDINEPKKIVVEQIVEEEEAGTIEINKVLTDEQELLNAWKKAIITTKNTNLPLLTVALETYNPTLGEQNTVEMVVANKTQSIAIDENRSFLIEELKQHLKVDYLKIKVTIDRNRNTDNKSAIPYTSGDRWKAMVEKNPHLDLLKDKLGLEIEF